MTLCVERDCFTDDKKCHADVTDTSVSETKTLKSAENGAIYRHEVWAAGVNGRQTPSYSQLCVVAMFFNPLLGGVAYLLNRRAQRRYQAHKQNHANFLYWCAICLSTTSIFLTVTLVLLIPVFRPLPDALQHGCQRPYSDEYMRRYTRTFAIDKNAFCGIVESSKLMKALDNYILFYEAHRIKAPSISPTIQDAYTDDKGDDDITPTMVGDDDIIPTMVGDEDITPISVDDIPTQFVSSPTMADNSRPNIVQTGELSTELETERYKKLHNITRR